MAVKESYAGKINRKLNKKLHVIDVAAGRVPADLVLKNAAYVNVFSNELCRGDIAVAEGLIVGMGEYHGKVEADVGGKIVLPGFIDAHTHFDLDVCSTTTVDDFFSGSRAALRGGTTTVVDFACPNKGETLHQGLELWHKKADGNCCCDYGFHMTIDDWNPGIEAEIDDMYAAGISSFKMYMTYPAMMIGDEAMYHALKKLKEKGGICGVHCENSGVIDALIAEKKAAGQMGVGSHPRTRPDFLEAEAVSRLLRIAQAVDIPVVAIGGIRADRIQPLKGTGADGVAVVSAIFGQPDIEAAARRLKETAEMYLGRHRRRKTVLTIAGSDSSGGAGIQADLKTMLANGVYGMSAITALTAQNTTGVSGIFPVTPEFLAMQIDSVFSDIRPDAVKIGMVSSGELIRVIAERLSYYKAENIVVDPVMISTSGSRLLDEDAVGALKELLLPMAAVATPNIPEAEVLSGICIRSSEDMVRAAEIISREYGCAVLCKGGHRLNDANDLLYRDGGFCWFMGRRIDNPNTHGTGCTLSSAIASGLARGYSLEQAVERAKEYLSGALEAMLDLGSGSGPMDHGFQIP